jgi:hypothetical protein
MNHQDIAARVCYIKCGSVRGTGFFVQPQKILTVAHNIFNANESVPIEIAYSDTDGVLQNATGHIVDSDEQLDAALIELDAPLCMNPFELREVPIRLQAAWETYGYPSYTHVGEYSAGKIKRRIKSSDLRYDIEITPDIIIEYSSEGLSGAPLVQEESVIGMIVQELSIGYGAISIAKLNQFLVKNGIEIVELVGGQNSPEIENAIERRSVFGELDNKILHNKSGALLLKGVPGIGKTTILATYAPEEEKIIVLHRYFIRVSGETVVLRRDPLNFISSLRDHLYFKLYGEFPATNGDFNSVHKELLQLLQAHSQRLVHDNKIGLIVVDSIDSVTSLEQFVSVFNQFVPSIVILLSSTTDSVLSYLPELNQNDRQIHVPNLTQDEALKIIDNRLGDFNLKPSEEIAIAEKSEGHPLYLNYLCSDFINNWSSEKIDQWLEQTVEIKGDISNYYRSLWTEIATDTSLWWILATIAETRIPISISELHHVLPNEVSNTLPVKFDKIRHLLKSDGLLEIYHSSFVNFVRSQTSEYSRNIHDKLAKYCIENNSLFAVTNKVYHSLFSTSPTVSIPICNQAWCDECAQLGVAPDLVILDVLLVKREAVRSKQIISIIEIQLLLQRIRFRYDYILAKYAHEIAEIYMLLGRSDISVKYLIRDGFLLIDNSTALEFIQYYLEKGASKEAEQVYDALDLRLKKQMEIQKTPQKQFEIYITWLQLRSQALNVKENDPRKLAEEITGRTDRFYKYLNKEAAKPLRYMVGAYFKAYFLAIFNVDAQKASEGEKKVQKKYGIVDDELTSLMLWHTVTSYINFTYEWTPSERHETIKFLANELAQCIQTYGCPSDAKRDFAPVLLEYCSDIEFTNGFLRSITVTSPAISNLRHINGVDLNWEVISEVEFQNKVEGYLTPSTTLEFNPNWNTAWESELRELIGVLSRSYGSACYFVNQKLGLELERLTTNLTNLLEKLKFSLLQRANWDKSYAIPENLIPHCYQLIAQIFRKTSSDKVHVLITHCISGSMEQLGLYTEGFFDCIQRVVEVFRKCDIIPTNLFELLVNLETHVLRSSQNRWVRSKQLLTVIRLYARIDRFEKAKEVFSQFLRTSLGPSWYKEDQFALINELSSCRYSNKFEHSLIQRLASVLDFASGEMTFQRFVQYEKESFISTLVGADKTHLAKEYLQFELLPSTEQVIQNAESSTHDEIAPGEGYVLGARSIFEVPAILSYIEKNKANPTIRLSLLELLIDNNDIDRYSNRIASVLSQLISTSFEADIETGKFCVIRFAIILSAQVSPSHQRKYLHDVLSDLTPQEQDFFIQHVAGIVSCSVEEMKTMKDQILTDKNKEYTYQNDDTFPELMPGMGKLSGIGRAKDYADEAERSVKSGDFETAKKVLRDGFNMLRENGSNIWLGRTLSDQIGRMYDALKASCNADQIIEELSLHISEYNYTDEWKVAKKLIQLVGEKLSEEDTMKLGEALCKHFEFIVCQNKPSLQKYNWINSAPESIDADKDGVELLIWLLTHPSGEYKRKVIAALVSLFECRPEHTLNMIVHTIVTEIGKISSELCARTLFEISKSNPKKIQEYLGAHLSKIVSIEHFMIRHYAKITIENILTAAPESKDYYVSLQKIEATIPKEISSHSEVVMDEDFLIPIRDTLETLNELEILDRDFCKRVYSKIETEKLNLKFKQEMRSLKYIRRSFYDIDGMLWLPYQYRLNSILNETLCSKVDLNHYNEVVELLEISL